jgi:hypothetical protein
LASLQICDQQLGLQQPILYIITHDLEWGLKEIISGKGFSLD